MKGRTRHRGRMIGLAAIAGAGAVLWPVRADLIQPAAQPAQQATIAQAASPEPTAEERARAREQIDALLFEGASPEQQAEIEAALKIGYGSLVTRELLGRMAQGRPVPGWAVDSVVRASETWDEASADAMARALAGARTRPAAEALISMVDRMRGSAGRQAVLGGLVDLTGRDDLPAEIPAWRTLLQETAGWSDERWFRAIAEWQAQRAARLADIERRASSRLLDTLKQIHVTTPATERSKLLSTLLSDPLVEVRLLGIDLALRELASANPLGPEVATSSLRLLADTDEGVRATAAGLVLQLSPAGASEVAAGALARETSPKAAIPLLRLAIRASGQTAVDQAIAWLESPDRGPEGATPTDISRACRDAAVDLAWHLTRRGIMNSVTDRARVMTSVRGIPAGELAPGGCFLTGLLGDATDIERIAGLLTSTDPAIRLAAAETVVVYAAHLDALLAAARADSRLVEVAVRGVQLHRQTAEGFVAIERVTVGRPELRRVSLVAVSDVLPAPEVLIAIESIVGEPDLKEAVLSTLARRERVSSERVDEARARAIADGLVRLARVRVQLGKPAEAIAALDVLADVSQIPSVKPRLDEAEVARLRVGSFVRLGRLADAEASTGPSDAEGWLDGLSAVTDKPFAKDVIERIDALFLGSMTEGQFARLQTLRRSIETSPNPDDPNADQTARSPR
ncbi:MAG: hypothetical protein HEQ23_12655 [Tepidisphaera sp.]